MSLPIKKPQNLSKKMKVPEEPEQSGVSIYSLEKLKLSSIPGRTRAVAQNQVLQITALRAQVSLM